MNTNRTWRAAAAAALLAAMAAASAVAASADAGAAAAETARFSACPRDALPLRADSVQRAADTALTSAARLYPGVNTRGAEVMAADRSAFAGARGGQVTFLCGQRAADRTVVVQMLFPRMLPSASLSEAVVFVARFASGYRVWYIAH